MIPGDANPSPLVILNEMPQNNQLFLIGFEILSHMSQRISVDAAEQDEYYFSFLVPIFEYFKGQQWTSTHFAKVIFSVIINNGTKREVTFEGDSSKNWQSLFHNMVRDTESPVRRSEGTVGL